MSRALRAVAGITALGVGGLGWALIEAQSYVLRKYKVPVLQGQESLKILHLSDLHLLPTDHRRIRWVQDLASHDPDLVVTTGDNLAHRDAVPAVLEALGPLLHLPGVFVTGSHDFHAPVLKNPFNYFRHREPSSPGRKATLPGRELIDALTSAGWLHLDNARAALNLRGIPIDFVGTGDAHMNAAIYPGGPTGADPALRIGVTHAPYRWVLDTMADDAVTLVLAGHTHGGQVCLPGFGALVTNCDLPRRLASGLHRWPNPKAPTGAGSPMWLHVSAGLGTSPFTPIRFACRPEASLIELSAHPD